MARVKVGGRELVLTDRQFPYTVKATHALSADAMIELREVRSLLAQLRSYRPPKVVAMSSRADRIEISFAGEVRQSLIGGRRELAFEWSGGAPPFQVTVQSDFSRELRCAVTTSESKTACVEAAYAPGLYLLRVTDATGLMAESRFEAVSIESTICIANAWNRPSSEDAALAATARAVRTFACGGEWRLEAYQSVRMYLPAFGPATALKDALQVLPPAPARSGLAFLVGRRAKQWQAAMR